MTGILRVFDPTPNAGLKDSGRLIRLKHLRGVTIGFIDNSKPNFDYLVDDLAQLLRSRYGVDKVVRYRKRVAGMGTPEATMRDMTDQCSLVITGSGD